MDGLGERLFSELPELFLRIAIVIGFDELWQNIDFIHVMAALGFINHLAVLISIRRVDEQFLAVL
jgi:hypothetical protein